MGQTLVQAVHHNGRWVALLVWGPAALKRTDRDHDIGWTDSQRAERSEVDLGDGDIRVPCFD